MDGLLRPAAAKPKRSTSRAVAAENRLRVLKAVAAHGHLRCADLATCWPGAKYGEQMAQRTVRALLGSGDVLARCNEHGGLSYVLTRLGAAALKVRDIEARHGLDQASVRGPALLCSRSYSRGGDTEVRTLARVCPSLRFPSPSAPRCV